MTPTDQPTTEPQAPAAGGEVWAVPGVDRIATDPAQPSGSPASENDSDSVPKSKRGSPEAAAQAATDWKTELQMAAQGPGGHVHPVVAAVAGCVDALEGVRDAGVGTLSAREVRMLLLAVAYLVAAAVALKLRLLVAGDPAGRGSDGRDRYGFVSRAPDPGEPARCRR